MRGRPDIQSIRKWAKVCGVILAVLMLRVWVNVQAERLERGLAAERLEADRLTYENGHLQMQIHQYEAPSSLEAIAKQQSMVPLDPSRRVGMQP
jgi:cell division protein FtsL